MVKRHGILVTSESDLSTSAITGEWIREALAHVSSSIASTNVTTIEDTDVQWTWDIVLYATSCHSSTYPATHVCSKLLSLDDVQKRVSALSQKSKKSLRCGTSATGEGLAAAIDVPPSLSVSIYMHILIQRTTDFRLYYTLN